MKGKICKAKHIQRITLAHSKIKTMMLKCFKEMKI